MGKYLTSIKKDHSILLPWPSLTIQPILLESNLGISVQTNALNVTCGRFAGISGAMQGCIAINLSECLPIFRCGQQATSPFNEVSFLGV